MTGRRRVTKPSATTRATGIPPTRRTARTITLTRKGRAAAAWLRVSSRARKARPDGRK